MCMSSTRLVAMETSITNVLIIHLNQLIDIVLLMTVNVISRVQ